MAVQINNFFPFILKVNILLLLNLRVEDVMDKFFMIKVPSEEQTEMTISIKNYHEMSKELSNTFKAPKDEWISVSESVPKEDYFYLVYYDICCISKAYFKHGRFFPTEEFLENKSPSHWKNLSAPPKEIKHD